MEGLGGGGERRETDRCLPVNPIRIQQGGVESHASPTVLPEHLRPALPLFLLSPAPRPLQYLHPSSRVSDLAVILHGISP